MKTQHTKMMIIGAGALIIAATLQSFSSADDKDKLKRYEVIHHENGKMLEFDTVIPMNSSYTVEQFLADKGISSENVKIIKVPFASGGEMFFTHQEGEGQQVEMNGNSENGKEVIITSEITPDGKIITRKTVDGKEVEVTEEELQEMEMEKKSHGVHEQKIIVHSERVEHEKARGAREQKMDVQIKCEIDENGEIHAQKWVNGQEVELTEEELEEMHTVQEGAHKVIIRSSSEGLEPSEEQAIEIEQIIEELKSGLDGEQQLVVIEKEIENGGERRVIQMNVDETADWNEATHSEVHLISSDEEDFTLVIVTENINSEVAENERVELQNLSNHVLVYPNPSSGLVTIEFANSEKVKTEVKITDMNGKVVFSEDLGKFSGSWRKEVDLNRFGKGNYLITIQQGKNTVSEKIIVE